MLAFDMKSRFSVENRKSLKRKEKKEKKRKKRKERKEKKEKKSVKKVQCKAKLEHGIAFILVFRISPKWCFHHEFLVAYK